MKKFLVLMVGGLMVLGFSMTASAGDYYQFSEYYGSGYGYNKYDVACYGNTIYYGSGTSVYSVDVAIADMTYVNAPKGDTNYQTRIFTNPKTITLSSDVNLNGGSTGEMYVDANSIYTTGGSDYNQVLKFNKTTGAYQGVAVANTNFSAPRASMLSYDSANGKWWMANEYGASGTSGGQVWSSTGGDWSYEFNTAPTLGGSHLDGMEFVGGNIWTSDMTSDHLQKYALDGTLLTTYDYTGTGASVEGMGFGALGHFWAGGGSYIYELGGGKVKPNNPVPEPATVLLLGSGLLGLGFYSRKRKNS